MPDNKQVKTNQIQDSNHDHNVEIKTATEGLQPEFLGILEKCDLNTQTICDYLSSRNKNGNNIVKPSNSDVETNIRLLGT